MKRILTASLMVAIGLTAGITSAQADEDVPLHAHGLLLNLEFDETGMPSFSKCIDLAANNRLPLNSHHDGVHTGTAGYANLEVGITRAGHGVIPFSPLSPFDDCAAVMAAFSQ